MSTTTTTTSTSERHAPPSTYSATCWSEAKLARDDRPPPSNMDSIKRMFRGLFKRGGNKRKAGEDKAVGARTGQRESPLPPLAPPKDTPPATASTPAKVAAQIAASPTRSPTQALPPSHPLATGQRRPLQPSPPDRDTNGGLAVGAGQAVVGRTSEQAQVSPRAITSAQAAEVQPRTSDAVSAMTEEPAAPSTSKVDSAVADLQTPKTSQADAAGALGKLRMGTLC